MTENKSIAISTIPIAKLTVLMNNFIFNTVNHLNKLSVKGDEKLAEFDRKLNDLEVMTTLLESKLNSLPEKITSTYPELESCELDDVNPVINPIPEVTDNQQNQNNPSSQENNTEQQQQNEENNENKENDEAEQKEEVAELTPQEEMDKLFEERPELQQLFKMLKFGVPKSGVIQKAQSNGVEDEVMDKFFELVHKVNPSLA